MEPKWLAEYPCLPMSDPGWGDFIRDTLAAKGLTQAELAAKLTVQPVQVSRWVRKVHTPPPMKREKYRKIIARLPSQEPPPG
jgi:transcriptional regulator with XRE-family HTH domain